MVWLDCIMGRVSILGGAASAGKIEVGDENVWPHVVENARHPSDPHG
jgi:hypothetical protein